MRLWSIHPRYLDRMGLIALWREGLLGRAVLAGKTRGYRNHPQLHRFREQKNPVRSLNAYLKEVWREGRRRGYRFDGRKLGPAAPGKSIPLTRGQLEFEVAHLLGKLRKRDKQAFEVLAGENTIEPHPIFRVKSGPVESWERIKQG
ncbi:MAG: hypothetical protein JXD22_16330 [Sedimentisphaerales bacterium]|nr:hypothetical protein [Sedimentisphaerales bacterium]